MATGEDGFSTLEALVAFAVLSLGLLGAVQSISQAAVNLQGSANGQARMAMLQQLRSEEMPKLARGYTGTPLAAKGETWRIELAPMRPDDPDGPVRFAIWIGGSDGPSNSYHGIVDRNGIGPPQ